MSFKRPSLPELMGRIDQDILSRMPGSQAAMAMRTTKALSASMGGLVHGLYGYLQWLERQLFPETCDDENLHLHSAGVPRRPASAATGVAVFEGNDGRAIVTGSELRAGNVEYVTTAEAVVVDGVAAAPVRAVTVGVSGNQAPGAELRLVSPVSGVAASATVDGEGIRGGADLEAFGSWRDRIMLRRARVPRGGAAGDWEEWALQVPGVTRAWEDPLGMGPGSVVLRIVSDDADDGPLPSEQLLTAVAKHIEALRNVQAKVYVVGPDTQEFVPQLLVFPNTDEARSSAAQALKDLVENEGVPGGTFLISRIRSAIGRAPGVEDYDLQWPTANVEHGTGVLPVWGGVQWIGA